jgi:uncharacterized membrane protein YoaK (UPF0700 family)
MDLFNTLVVAASEPNVQGFVAAARDFIAPIFMLVVGVVALSFLMRRQITAFLQFFALVVLIAVVFYFPGVFEGFARWVAGLFFGGDAPAGSVDGTI